MPLCNASGNSSSTSARRRHNREKSFLLQSSNKKIKGLGIEEVLRRKAYAHGSLSLFPSRLAAVETSVGSNVIAEADGVPPSAVNVDRRSLCRSSHTALQQLAVVGQVKMNQRAQWFLGGVNSLAPGKRRPGRPIDSLLWLQEW